MVSADVYKPNLNTTTCICPTIGATIISEQSYLNAIDGTGFVYPGDLYPVNAFCRCPQSAYLHTADIPPYFMKYRAHGQTNYF